MFVRIKSILVRKYHFTGSVFDADSSDGARSGGIHDGVDIVLIGGCENDGFSVFIDTESFGCHGTARSGANTDGMIDFDGVTIGEGDGSSWLGCIFQVHIFFLILLEIKLFLSCHPELVSASKENKACSVKSEMLKQV
jgi:hypothetical protein